MKYKGKWEVCLYLLQKSIVLLWCKIWRRFVFTLWIWVVIADPKNCKLKLKNKNSRQECVFKWCLFCFCISHSSSWNKYFIALQKEERKINKRKTKRKKVPWPGFEPGLLRPQRSVLTTRRSRRTICAGLRFNKFERSYLSSSGREWRGGMGWGFTII